MTRKTRFGWFVLIALFGISYWSVDVLSVLAAARKTEPSAQAKPVQAPVSAEAAPGGSATLSGKVSLSGSAPAGQKIKMAADPVCLQQHKEAVTSQEVVSSNGNLQYVLVYIKEGAQGGSPAPAQAVVLDQSGCMYQPHVFGIQVGQKLEIVNSDPTLHNINCQPKANKKFNIAQPAGSPKREKSFDQPEVGIPLKCNVHPWMVAYAGVFDHPYFAVSGQDGGFQIQGLPAGSYTVEAWHEKLGVQSQKVTVADGETKEISFSFASK